jgi:hypothetical protein
VLWGMGGYGLVQVWVKAGSTVPTRFATGGLLQ